MKTTRTALMIDGPFPQSPLLTIPEYLLFEVPLGDPYIGNHYCGEYINQSGLMVKTSLDKIVQNPCVLNGQARFAAVTSLPPGTRYIETDTEITYACCLDHLLQYLVFISVDSDGIEDDSLPKPVIFTDDPHKYLFNPYLMEPFFKEIAKDLPSEYKVGGISHEILTSDEDGFALIAYGAKGILVPDLMERLSKKLETSLIDLHDPNQFNGKVSIAKFWEMRKDRIIGIPIK